MPIPKNSTSPLHMLESLFEEHLRRMSLPVFVRQRAKRYTYLGYLYEMGQELFLKERD